MIIINQAAGDTKLRELILYVCQKSKGDERFGMTKLNKILFFADFQAYVKLGKAITGQEYQCLKFGPAPRRMLPNLEVLTADSDLQITHQEFGGTTQKVPVALRHANLGMFSAEEIALVDNVIHEHRRSTARNVSDLSHQFLGWKLADEGETIPYSVGLVGVRELTPDEVKHGLQLERELA